MNKKIIYIVGCGRSGSTLMGFALGNATRALDLGEVIDFCRLEGRPNGFGPDSENYRYWEGVLRRLESELGPVDFSALRKLQRQVDHHKSFLPLFLLGSRYRREAYLPYQRYLKALYGVILDESDHDVFIASSKYPSRLLHLRRAFPDQTIHVIHLIRNPIDLACAFRNKEQGKTKTFWESMLYFFVVNAFSVLATRGLGPKRYLKIHLEDFICDPRHELTRIGAAFAIDTSPAIEKIERGRPLDRGYVFNGNRMRMKNSVVFQRSQRTKEKRKAIERAAERLAGLVFGRATAKDTNNSSR